MFIDVGAWIGPMTLVAAACGARVVAYEPDPTAADELAANVALNPGFDVTVERVALWTSTGTRQFRGGPAGLGESMSSFSGRAGRIGSTDRRHHRRPGCSNVVAGGRIGEGRCRGGRVQDGSTTATVPRDVANDGVVGPCLRRARFSRGMAVAGSTGRPPRPPHGTRRSAAVGNSAIQAPRK